MRKSIPMKIAVAGAGIVMAGGVAAAAVTTPDEASDQLGDASAKAGFEVPTSGDVQPVKNQNEVEEETTELEVTTTTEAEEELEEVQEVEEPEVEGEGPSDTHGAVVSEFAQTTELEGKDKGQAIAEVAKSDEGKPDQAAQDDEETETVEEAGKSGDHRP